MSANERQVGGSHYKRRDGGEEHWDRVYRLKLDYFQAQITKYVERWKLKNGVEDLKKARHFLDKYIELVEAGLLSSESSKFKTAETYQKTFPVPSGTLPEPNRPEPSPHEDMCVHGHPVDECNLCYLNNPPGDRSGS